MQASINDPLMQLLPFLERARTFRHWVGKFGSQVALQLGGAMERRGSLPPHSLAAHLLECLDPATGELLQPLYCFALVLEPHTPTVP